MNMNQDPNSYIEALYKLDEELENVIRSIDQHDMPQISIAPGYGRLLTLLVKMAKPKRILEIGALGGYSGICLARGLEDDGALVSLELKNEFAEAARTNLKAVGLGNKVEYRIGDAKETLKRMIEEGEKYDFFFIDADKSGYPYYLEAAIALSRRGAVIVGDNTLQNGRVLNTEEQSTSVRAMREFNQRIAEDARLDSTILPAYDGLAVARVK
jgi:caffeoyl-CoA O-methyltransferase